jgi:hypothetical protein
MLIVRSSQTGWRPRALACGYGPSGSSAPTTSKEYPSVDAYMKQFTKGLDAMIKAGYVVSTDRAQLIAAQKEKATQVLGQ